MADNVHPLVTPIEVGLRFENGKVYKRYLVGLGADHTPVIEDRPAEITELSGFEGLPIE